MKNLNHNIYYNSTTVNSRLTATPLLRMLAITDKIWIPGKSFRGLTGNDSRYNGIVDTFFVLKW